MICWHAMNYSLRMVKLTSINLEGSLFCLREISLWNSDLKSSKIWSSDFCETRDIYIRFYHLECGPWKYVPEGSVWHCLEGAFLDEYVKVCQAHFCKPVLWKCRIIENVSEIIFYTLHEPLQIKYLGLIDQDLNCDQEWQKTLNPCWWSVTHSTESDRFGLPEATSTSTHDEALLKVAFISRFLSWLPQDMYCLAIVKTAKS